MSVVCGVWYGVIILKTILIYLTHYIYLMLEEYYEVMRSSISIEANMR